MNTALIPKDTQDFQFKHASTHNVCEPLDQVPTACSLIVADGKRGVLYIGYKNKLIVLKYSVESSDRCSIDYDLPYPISKLSLSCDFSYLSVIFNKSTVYIYNAGALSRNSLEILHEIQISSSSSNVFGYDLRWNPAIPGMFCTIASDHSIGCFHINFEQKTTLKLVAMEKIVNLEAMCVAWSPKGKQLVIGCKNGNIVQLKPELKVARTIPGPSPAIGEVIGILWISNYQFCAAYSNVNERRVNVLIVNAPKGEAVAKFICYEDITFGMPDMEGEYLPRYYFDHIPEWNIIIAASSSSSEIAILGSLDNCVNWEQWQLIDSARAQLPLIRTIETYPVGITIDKSPVIQLPWGSENTLPNPVPILHIFGTSGQIISFHMVNLQPNCPSICSPPSEPITITPKPRLSMLPSEISFENHLGITSTPRPKQVETVIEKSKPLPNVNLFNNSLTTTNFMPASSLIPPTAPLATQVITSTPTPVAHVDLRIPKPRPEKIEVTPVQKTEHARLSPAKEISVAAPTPENTNLDDSICWRACQEELLHFEKELRAKLEPQVWQVGTDEEKQKLILQYAEIDEFWRELRETTSSLSNEIAYLKALLLQSFAWVEETKSRKLANDSDNPRDRHDRSKIQELQRLANHTQSQLIQAMKAIDMQWSDYQSQERTKMKIPSLEYVYQTLKNHAEIIARQKKNIEQQTAKLKVLNKFDKISSLNRSIANMSLNSNQLEGSFGVNVNGGVIEMRCRAIANDTKNFTKEKQRKLREILLQNTPKVIKPVMPTPVQDRLEATLSSLATHSPVTAPSKQMSGKLVPERPNITKEKQMITTTITPTPTPTTAPVQKTTAGSQNPLTVLSSIVENIGTSGSEAVATTTPPPPPQSKLQSTPFTMNAFPSIFTNTSSAEKISTLGNMQFNFKSTMANQSPNVPPQPSTTQPTAVASAFPKVMSISFGTSDQKNSETAAPINLTPKEAPQKIIPSSKPNNTMQFTQSLFDTNLFASSVSTGSSASKINQPATTLRNQMPTSLESSSTLSFKDALPPATTSPQNVFSFANPSTTTVAPKIASSNAPSESIQTFSFASKPSNPPAITSTNSVNFSIAKPTDHGSLDLSKMTVGLSSSIAAEKPTGTSSNLVGNTFADLATPISSTINFGKILSSTPTVTQPEQENKTAVILPPGTSIEKVGGFTGASNQTTSSSINFGANSALTSNILGTSMFGGGTSLSSALPQVSPLSTSVKTPTVTSATSIFSTSANNVFTQSLVTSSSAPAPPSYSSSQFSNILGNPAGNIRFGQPAKTTEVPSIFNKTPITTVPSTVAAPASPFAPASSSPLSVSNIVSTSTTTSTPSTGFFTNNSGLLNNSIFGNMTSTTSAATKIFGGNSSGSTAPSSLFGGTATAPVSSPAPTSSPFQNSIFGGSSTLGAQPSQPSAAPVFGVSPAFAAKPFFTGPTPIFGAITPEFGIPFGSSGLSSSPGFGSAPSMPGSPPSFGNAQMSKAFGNPTGNSSFESLAGQNNQLTFDSLAQKSPSPEKPPTFSGGSSFSSWR